MTPERNTILPGVILCTCLAALFLAAKVLMHLEATAHQAIACSGH
jgi:hypothetical protein